MRYLPLPTIGGPQTLRAKPPRPTSSHFPLLVRFCFAGRRVLSRPRRFRARRRAVLTGPSSPRTIAVGGMGADLRRSRTLSGSSGSLPRRRPLSAWHVVFASRPASIRTCPSPQARCQMGSLVLVGRCYLRDDLDWIKARNAVCPIATVMLYFDASQCSHSSLAVIEFNPSYRISPSSSYAAFACLLFRSGSYTSPLIHKQCNSTDNFRATAITARFLAFFPPRSQRRSPKRRRSLSFPCGPSM